MIGENEAVSLIVVEFPFQASTNSRSSRFCTGIDRRGPRETRLALWFAELRLFSSLLLLKSNAKDGMIPVGSENTEIIHLSDFRLFPPFGVVSLF